MLAQPPAEEARFVFKPDFGRVPAYLEATKAHIRQERAELDAQLAAREVCVLAFPAHSPFLHAP